MKAGIAHLPLVRLLAPDAARELDGFDLAAIAGTTQGRQTVHGDLHEAQLLVEDGRLSALLDIDTAGRGDPRDDWATFLGHLVVKAQIVEGDEQARVRAYARDVAAVLQSCSEDPQGDEQASARVAAVILGLATSAFASLAPNWAELADERVRLAASWLRGEGYARVNQDSGAELEDENRLIGVSQRTHAQDSV